MRRLIPLIAALAMAVSSALPARAADAPTFTIRFNTVASPQQPQVKGLEVFRRELERLSGGKIRVKIFHSGQLGDQQTQTLGVMRGTLEMTFTDPNTTAQFDPRVGIFGAAYLFRDLPHMHRVMDGPVGAEYFARLATERGMRPLGVWYLGTRELNLRDRAVRTPADMRGVKLRMPNSPSWIAMGRALGASPTPLGFGEVYLALKTGVVDGQDNPLPTDKAQKFHEVTRYIILTHHQIGMLWPTVNERFWQRLPAEYRAWVLEALRAGREHQNKLVLDAEAALIAEFRDVHGMTIVEPDVEAFRAHAREVYREFEAEWGVGVYDRIRAVP